MAELLLGVNIDHIATLRNARGTAYPDPVQAAFIAEQAGADGITVHLREDRRHITDRDVRILRQTLDTRMNLEMAVTEEMLAIAVETKPHFCCLVPEKRQEVTTEGGLDVAGQRDKMRDACKRLAEAGIAVRAGLHCAPLIHETLGTMQQGAVRVSLGFSNTESDVKALLHTLDRLAKGAVV